MVNVEYPGIHSREIRFPSYLSGLLCFESISIAPPLFTVVTAKRLLKQLAKSGPIDWYYTTKSKTDRRSLEEKTWMDMTDEFITCWKNTKWFPAYKQ